MYIYQYKDGGFLPWESQPENETDFLIKSKTYCCHQSTRFVHVSIGNNGIAERLVGSKLIECNKDLPELYSSHDRCCGCTACYSICPAKAISMRPDEEGFLYPVVDAERCMRCYKCISVCDYQISLEGADIM